MLGRHEILVGLGSNSVDALARLRAARRELRSHPRFRLIFSSPIYASDALLPPGAPKEWDLPFLNAACRLETDGISATEIVNILKGIEGSLGRRSAPRWAPRLIDLDLLAWGGPDVTTEKATVPHPGLHERPFAILPALDCARVSGSDRPHPWRYAAADDVPLRTRRAPVGWTELVGILNVTPDSFSDGRARFSAAEIEATSRRLVREGAHIIDVGGESTRPGATPVPWTEEIMRLTPALEVLTELKRELGIQLSVDTRHPETAARILEKFGVDWLNDVGGFENPEMQSIARASRCRLVVMHSLGVPPTPAVTLPLDVDPLHTIGEWGKRKIETLTNLGIEPDRIILDPGIGFGKTAAQNFALARRAGELHRLGAAILIGHSRKRFLDVSQEIPAPDRDLETAILTAQIASGSPDYIRVHAPGGQRRALQLGAGF